MKTAIFLLVAGLALAAAAPELGDCIVDSPAPLNDTGKVRIESCHQCQWECLTDAQCRGITFDGDAISKADLALLADCGDGFFTNVTLSPGLCVLYHPGLGFINDIADVQHQDCAACAQQCNYEGQCQSFAYNGVTYPKGASCEATVAPIVVPPSPVPVIPSPVLPPPSPVPPPPSPAVRPDKPGIVVRPGICNYDIIKYEVAVIQETIILDSDECCMLCANTTGCNVASFCFDSEDNAGCGPNGAIPRYTCQLGTATLGADGYPATVVPTDDPEAKGWVTVTVTPAKLPELFP